MATNRSELHIILDSDACATKAWTERAPRSATRAPSPALRPTPKPVNGEAQ